MRIVQIVSQTRLGVAENFALLLSQSLLAAGHEVRLLALRDNGRLFETARPDLPRAVCRRGGRIDLNVVRFLLREFRSFRPQIVHAHNTGPNIWARAVRPLVPWTRVVCHFHSGLLMPERQFLRERILNRQTSMFVCVSPEISRYISDHRLIPPERVRTVPAAIDPTPFLGRRAEESILPPAARNRPRVLHTGSLIPVKNQALLLKAFGPAARATDAVLLLAGDGPLRTGLAERAAALGLSDRVFFLGERDDIPSLLALATVFVLPSKAEGFPLSVLEAMASEVCPVASRVGGIPEMLDQGRAGILVPPEDPEALGAALLRVLNDSGERSRLARAARLRVEQRYSIGVIAESTVRIYQEVLDRGSA